MRSLTPRVWPASALQVRAKAVVVNADPFRLRDLVGPQHFGPALNSKLDGMKKDGTTLKVGPCRLLPAACCLSDISRQLQERRAPCT